MTDYEDLSTDELMELARKYLTRKELEAMIDSVYLAACTWSDAYLKISGKTDFGPSEMMIAGCMFLDIQRAAVVECKRVAVESEKATKEEND